MPEGARRHEAHALVSFPDRLDAASVRIATLDRQQHELLGGERVALAQCRVTADEIWFVEGDVFVEPRHARRVGLRILGPPRAPALLEPQTIERPHADVDEAVKKIAEANPNFEAKPAGEAAANGDRVTVEFEGSIDGKLFDGGSTKDIPVVIGSHTFIPGFEEQLVGIGVGETKTLNVTFPENYTNEKLAGKPAEFKTTATKIEVPKVAEVNDEFAKQAGMESLEKLKEAVKGRIAAAVSYTHLRAHETVLDLVCRLLLEKKNTHN